MIISQKSLIILSTVKVSWVWRCSFNAKTQVSFIKMMNTSDMEGALALSLNEPRYEKNGLRGFRPGLTQTGLYSHRR